MSISVVVLTALVEAVERANYDRREFLSAAGFPPERLEDMDTRVSQNEYDVLVERALDLTGEPSLGLRMGLGSTTLESSLPGQLVFQATTVREGLKLAEQFHRLFVDDCPWVVEESGREARISVTVPGGSPRCRRFGSEVAAGGLYRLVHHFVPLARPEWVSFEHAAPAYRPEYTRAFHGTERFEQSFVGIVIERALMDAHGLNRDDALHAVLKAQAAKRLARIEHAASFGDKVREYVVAFPEREHDMVAVARALGITPRTLRRRLSEEDATFRGVVEAALASVAIRLLVDEQKTIQEASHEMSFSEASAFCRAFKRWTGSTPRQYQLSKGVRA